MHCINILQFESRSQTKFKIVTLFSLILYIINYTIKYLRTIFLPNFELLVKLRYLLLVFRDLHII